MTKCIFCGDFMTWDLTIWQKSKKDASTDSGLGASAQTLVLRRINFDPEVVEGRLKVRWKAEAL